MFVTFELPGGRRQDVEVREGQSLMEAARDAGLPVEGTCGGNLSCATCHMILGEADFRRLGPPGEEECGMLDLADGVERTSRLGCQIIVDEFLGGALIRLPG
jgi:ferredoxin